MNPLIKSYLEQIDGEIAVLEDVTDRLRHQLKDLESSRNELLRDFWAKEKEVSVHKAAAQGFAAIRDQNEALLARETALREHLARVLGYTKSLTEELRQ